MLTVLRQIVQEVNESPDFMEALQLIVRRVSSAMKVEACAVYLANDQKKHYQLVASRGYLEGIDGKVILSFSEGLVGLVAERGEPINLSDAQNHPRFRYFPEMGEERYQAYLGVPIIHQRKLVGVLAVQQRQPRRFSEREEAFLITICAQLSGYIAHAKISDSVFDAPLRGNPTAPGIAIGTAVVVPCVDLETVIARPVSDIPNEIKAFEKALETTRQEIVRLKNQLDKMLLQEEQNLFDAYLRILESQSIKQDIVSLIEEGHWAPWALKKVIKRRIRQFEMMEDPYLRERGADLMDLGKRVLVNLQNENLPAQVYPPKTILVGEEISASVMAEVPQGHLAGWVSAKGSACSHAAILARAMHIPAVTGVTGLPIERLNHRQIVVDGYNGEILTSPSEKMIADFLRLAQEEKQLFETLEKQQDLESQTQDGVAIHLYANAGLITDIAPAICAGAKGIGLYRTEVPFMIRDRFPSEEEQYLTYRQLLERFFPKPVTIRTLDIGGDKFLPYFPVKEQNPFLGWRGIRVTLDHPQIFLLQLRAMLRANAGLNNLRVLFPMITSVSELIEALRLLQQAYREVVHEGSVCDFPKTGVMIEVPAAIYQLSVLAKQVDFISIGTNDLTQYLLATDRNNLQVANLYDPLHPAVIQALKMIIEGAKEAQKSVCVCGEMANDPIAVIVLLGLGFDNLSMNTYSIPRVKWMIRHLTLARAKQAAEAVLHMVHPAEIRLFLENLLEECGLGGLVRAGK